MTDTYPDESVEAFDRGEIDWSKVTPSNVKIVRDGGPMSALSVRLDATDIDRLRRRAEAEGVGLTQLVRQWILERLDEPPAPTALTDLMAALEASLRAARAIRRTTPTS